MAQTVDCVTPESRWTKRESISGVLERNTTTQEPPYGQCTGEWQLKFSMIKGKPGNPFAYPWINIVRPFCYLCGKCSFSLI